MSDVMLIDSALWVKVPVAFDGREDEFLRFVANARQAADRIEAQDAEIKRLREDLNVALCRASEREQESGLAKCYKKNLFQLGLIAFHVKEKESLHGKIKRLREEIRQPFLSLHMDGRNEHGTHLLTLPGASIEGDELELIMSDTAPGDDQSEEIYRDAERLGFRDGDAIVTAWHYERYEPALPQLEYQRVSAALTALFWGSPDEQHTKKALKEVE